MKNEITGPQMIILMKSGLVLWVTKETAEKVQEHLNSMSSHAFLKIRELGESINTAEMDGVYTPGRYTELNRIKQGDWQCEYKKWHQKKERCECAKYARQEERRKKEADEEAEMNRPRTPEEQEAAKKAIRYTHDCLRITHVLPIKKGATILRSSIVRYEKEHGKEVDLAGLPIEEDII